ncbi:MFS transporter [Clostridium magnum]|uniref:Inner membrane transport protein YajR n=1 Tax=Clostridium magnum DSM 2767 TaxID=1121326 RepID=A0A161YNL8_9CLOT|nr:MFS transporter [Clostridium magnum]KZL92312.1 inner membrane transport protein YajR [Clostridium magnum DSM 2767]SHH13787.1 Predicted arabinose efflux permease, MFS family [Clostridium magnum DSM 2767]
MQNIETYKKNFRIPLFYFVTISFWFAMYTYVPVLAVYVEQLGGSHKMAGLILGSYGFVQMCMRIPLGIASDRLHKRRLFITFGLAFTFISSFGMFISKDLTWILIFRSLAGAAAATWVDFTVLFTSYYKHNEATKAIGIINFLNGIAQMLAMLLGGFFAQRIGVSSTFALGAVIGAVGLIASFFIVDNFDENSKKITLKQIGGVIKDRNLIAVSILAILSQLLTFSTVFGFTPVFAKTIGANNFDMGLLTVFSSLPSALASLFGGIYLAKRFGEKPMVVLGFLIMGVLTITIPFTTNLVLLMITQAIAGFGRGISFTLLMGLSIKHISADRRATAMGFFQSIYGLGMFFGPVVVGILGDALNLSKAFVFLGIVGCITAFLAVKIIESGKSSLRL